VLNFASYFFAPGGWGTHARSFAGALHRLTPIALDHWHTPRSLADPETGVAEILATNLSPSATAPTIAIVPGANIPPMVGRYKIGFFVWETSRIPEHFCQALDRFDALWVPSLWQRQVAIQSGLAADRIRVVPEGVDPLVFCPADRPLDPDRPFRFVTIGKWERRKGIDLAIAAFARAFGPRDRVELVLHSHNSYQPGFELQAAIARAAHALGADPSRIRPSYPQRRSHLVELLQQADAFLLPTRGEGWGLPILEAMACGLPCIVTDWSGLRAYAHPGNSYLIPVKSFVPVDDPPFFDPALDWGCWAEPDLEAIVALMQRVYRDRAGARQVGAIAQAEAAEFWTWDRAAQTALAHLSQLCP
jgi:glycosyltransferase involved in cell wall biosynthesis